MKTEPLKNEFPIARSNQTFKGSISAMWSRDLWGRQGGGLRLTCHTPTTALAIRIIIMTMGSTNAVVVSSPSSNQARIW